MTCTQDTEGYWYVDSTEDCQGMCFEGSTFGSFCVLDTQQDASCKGGSEPFCDGTTLVKCKNGYESAKYDCAGAQAKALGVTPTPGVTGGCVATGMPATCVAEPTPNPDCSDGSTCSGDDYIRCRGKYVIERIPCGPNRCRIDSGSVAFCALSEDPDPGCVAAAPYNSYCDGNVRVGCMSNYAVSREQCAEDKPCGPSSWGGVYCKPLD